MHDRMVAEQFHLRADHVSRRNHRVAGRPDREWNALRNRRPPGKREGSDEALCGPVEIQARERGEEILFFGGYLKRGEPTVDDAGRIILVIRTSGGLVEESFEVKLGKTGLTLRALHGGKETLPAVGAPPDFS